jgi:hypothetical protein
MIKRALVRYPTFATKEACFFLKLFLEKDGSKRLQNALGPDPDPGDVSRGISYDYLRGLDFFKLGGRYEIKIIFFLFCFIYS